MEAMPSQTFKYFLRKNFALRIKFKDIWWNIYKNTPRSIYLKFYKEIPKTYNIKVRQAYVKSLGSTRNKKFPGKTRDDMKSPYEIRLVRR